MTADSPPTLPAHTRLQIERYASELLSWRRQQRNREKGGGWEGRGRRDIEERKRGKGRNIEEKEDKRKNRTLTSYTYILNFNVCIHPYLSTHICIVITLFIVYSITKPLTKTLAHIKIVGEVEKIVYNKCKLAMTN